MWGIFCQKNLFFTISNDKYSQKLTLTWCSIYGVPPRHQHWNVAVSFHLSSFTLANKTKTQVELIYTESIKCRKMKTESLPSLCPWNALYEALQIMFNERHVTRFTSLHWTCSFIFVLHVPSCLFDFNSYIGEQKNDPELDISPFFLTCIPF